MRFAAALPVLAALAMPARAAADGVPTAELSASDEAVRPAFDLLEDPAGTLSVADVRGAPTGQLRRVTGRVLNLGYTGSTCWIRFAVHNLGGDDTVIVSLPTTIDAADLFVDGSDAAVHAGKLVPFASREVRQRSTSFRVAIAPGATRSLYLRLRTNNPMLIAPIVRSEQAFWAAVSAENLGFGIYYGLLLAMIIYNLIVFLALRDAIYLHYVVFQAAFAAMAAALDQLLLEHLWPAHPEWSTRSEICLAGVTMTAAVMFTRAFLSTRRGLPVTDRVLRTAAAAAALLALAGLIVEHHGIGVLIRLAAVVQCALIAWAIVRARRAGQRGAAILAVAWLTLLGSVLVSAVSGLGLLPRLYAGPYALKIGSAAEAMLLALGLAQRIKRARQDKERAQAELLEDRAAQARVLECKVEERTAALSEALRSLRDAQDAMVTQARLAALGHLISGIAHEIGNPLNFSLGGAAELRRRIAAIEAVLHRIRPALDGDAARNDAAAADEAFAAVRKAAALIDAGNARIKRLIDALRSQIDGRSVEPQPTDLIAELESVTTLIEARARDQRIAIRKQLQPLPALAVRPGEIGQVVLNLLLNSCTAMPDGGQIWLACEASPDAIAIRVSDTGPGIPPEHRQAVFDPFFTTRPPGEGTGLGLAISYDIARRHGGTLTLADGDAGRGATFVLRLPLDTSR